MRATHKALAFSAKRIDDIYCASCKIVEPRQDNFNRGREFYRVLFAFDKNDDNDLEKFDTILEGINSVATKAWNCSFDIEGGQWYDNDNGEIADSISVHIVDGDNQAKPHGASDNWEPWENVKGMYVIRANKVYRDDTTLPIVAHNKVNGRVFTFDRANSQHRQYISERANAGCRLKAVKLTFAAWQLADRFVAIYIDRVQLAKEPSGSGVDMFDYEDDDGDEELEALFGDRESVESDVDNAASSKPTYNDPKVKASYGGSRKVGEKRRGRFKPRQAKQSPKVTDKDTDEIPF